MAELFSEDYSSNFRRKSLETNFVFWHLNFANLFLPHFHACLATMWGRGKLELVNGGHFIFPYMKRCSVVLETKEALWVFLSYFAFILGRKWLGIEYILN